MIVLSSACNNDDEDDPCIAGSLEETIVGSWTVTGDGLSGGDVEFKSDGTLIDNSDVFVGVEDAPDEKSYIIDSDLYFAVSSSYQGFTVEIDYDVASYTCNEIILDVFGSEMKMKRK